ncbi:MAG: nitroreductase family deazaflavin-dependent oxidoreductase [Acidimicrobiales bacterium]
MSSTTTTRRQPTGAVDRLARSTQWKEAATPRLSPGGLREIGPTTWLLSRLGGWAMGGRRVRILDTVGRHRPLMHGYMRFGVALVPRGRLPRADIELVTLRTTWNIGGRYEFFHHIFIARNGGLSIDTVERVTEGPNAAGWTERQAALLTATDELYAHRMLSDDTWARLAEFLDEGQIVELCFLVGHYEMLGMFLKSVGVTPEPKAWTRGPFAWARADDDSDRLFPSWLPAVNKRVTNRALVAVAPFVPPWAVIRHVGRRSGAAYRTPVVAFPSGDVVVIPLPYGDQTDWVRNLLTAGRGQLDHLGHSHAIYNPRITDVATDGHVLPGYLRRPLRFVKILIADREEAS